MITVNCFNVFQEPLGINEPPHLVCFKIALPWNCSIVYWKHLCPFFQIFLLPSNSFHVSVWQGILYWARYIRTEGPIFVSGGSGVDLLQLLLFLPDRSPALATLWSFCASATLSFLLTICSSFFILIQHCSVCLWRSKCTMEKWLSWHAYYVNVFLIPKSNIP